MLSVTTFKDLIVVILMVSLFLLLIAHQEPHPCVTSDRTAIPAKAKPVVRTVIEIRPQEYLTLI